MDVRSTLLYIGQCGLILSDEKSDSGGSEGVRILRLYLCDRRRYRDFGRRTGADLRTVLPGQAGAAGGRHRGWAVSGKRDFAERKRIYQGGVKIGRGQQFWNLSFKVTIQHPLEYDKQNRHACM